MTKENAWELSGTPDELQEGLVPPGSTRFCQVPPMQKVLTMSQKFAERVADVTRLLLVLREQVGITKT